MLALILTGFSDAENILLLERFQNRVMEAVQERMFIFEWRQTQDFSYRKFLQSNPQKSRESFSMRREAQTLLAKRILFIND